MTLNFAPRISDLLGELDGGEEGGVVVDPEPLAEPVHRHHRRRGRGRRGGHFGGVLGERLHSFVLIVFRILQVNSMPVTNFC